MLFAKQLEDLTAYYKENRDNFNENFRLKMHRTLSWLKKADKEENRTHKANTTTEYIHILEKC